MGCPSVEDVLNSGDRKWDEWSTDEEKKKVIPMGADVEAFTECLSPCQVRAYCVLLRAY